MRMLVMTAVATALLTMPVQAQQMTPGQAPWQSLPKMDNHAQDDDHPTKKADDSLYHSALDGIQAKQTTDPWGNVRQAPQPKNTNGHQQ